MTNGKQSRLATIDAILSDLVSYMPTSGEKAGVEETVRFFGAIRSIRGYVRWLAHARRTDPSVLLELTDLPFERWDRAMHKSLIALERKTFPGLIRPLVQKIVKFVREGKENSHPLLLAHFGGGGMEVDRQVIQLLIASQNNKPVIIVGFDKSPVAQDVALHNLSDIGSNVSVQFYDRLDQQMLRHLQENPPAQYTVCLCTADVLGLDLLFQTQTFDLVYHSLFKHHLSAEQKMKMDAIAINIARHVYEYDGYKHWFFVVLPHTLTAWNDPVFLNASILSDLRYQTKHQLLKNVNNGWKISLSRIATYLREYPA